MTDYVDVSSRLTARGRGEKTPRGLDVESVAEVSSEPVSIGDALAYLRISDLPSDQARVLEMLISTVREQAERLTRRLFTRRQVVARWEFWRRRGDLVYPPVGSVTTVERVADDGTLTALSGSAYRLNGRALVLDESAADAEGEGLRVTYDAGYNSLPAPLKTAMLNDLDSRYDARGTISEANFSEIPNPSLYQTWRAR
jgi:uncharacterized phiE125 gp8 family phage protein